MEDSLSGRLIGYARNAAPSVLILTGVLVLKLPFGLPAISSLAPVFAICSIYYWVLYRPLAFPVGLTFLIGFFIDLLSSGPFGVHCLVLLLTHGLTLTQRSFLANKAPWVIWLGEIVIAWASVIAYWLVHSVYQFTLMPVVPMIFQLALTIILYPVVSEFYSFVRVRVLKV